MFRCCLTSWLVVFTTSLAAAGEPFFVYAPDPSSNQVTQWEVSSQGDKVSIARRDSLKLLFTPSSLAWNQPRQQLIVTSGVKGPHSSATIETPSSGQMRLLATSSLKHPTGYTSVDRTGQFLLTANYRHGIIAVYRIENTGPIGKLAASIETPNAEAHCILTTPDNRFAYVPCVKNNNALFQFAFEEDSGDLTPLQPFNANPPAMFGPRHAAYHPSLPLVYFSNEQQLGISVYRIQEDGQLTDIQHAATMPRRSPFVQGRRDLHASDLALTRDGKRLFVAVRDFNGDEDSVFSFRLDAEGKLSLVARSRVGDIPWKLALSPNERLLLLSETGEQRLSVFHIATDGALTPATSFDWKIAARDLVVPHHSP